MNGGRAMRSMKRTRVIAASAGIIGAITWGGFGVVGVASADDLVPPSSATSESVDESPSPATSQPAVDPDTDHPVTKDSEAEGGTAAVGDIDAKGSTSDDAPAVGAPVGSEDSVTEPAAGNTTPSAKADEGTANKDAAVPAAVDESASENASQRSVVEHSADDLHAPSARSPEPVEPTRSPTASPRTSQVTSADPMKPAMSVEVSATSVDAAAAGSVGSISAMQVPTPASTAGTVASRVVSALFRILGFDPNHAGAAAAQPALAVLWASWQQITRRYLNSYPSVSPGPTTSTDDGVVTGSLGAQDADGDLVTYTVIDGPDHGTLVVQANGSYTYTPDPEYAHAIAAQPESAAVDTFAVLVSDDDPSNGRHLHLFSRTPRPAPATVTVPIASTNTPPAAQSGDFTTAGGSATGQVTGHDDDGDSLTYAITGQPVYGTVMIDGKTGSWTYTSTTDDLVLDAFTVEVSDGHGAATPVQVAVYPPAVATPTEVVVTEDGSSTLVLGDSEAPVTVLTEPEYGSVARNPDGTWTYTPDPVVAHALAVSGATEPLQDTVVFGVTQSTAGRPIVVSVTAPVVVVPVNHAPTGTYELGSRTTSTRTVTRSKQGVNAVAASPDGSTLYVTNYGQITQMTPAGSVRDSFTTPDAVEPYKGLVISPDGEKLYVLEDSPVIWVLGTDSQSPANYLLVGLDDMEDIDVSPDGSTLYVVTSGKWKAVAAVNAATGEVLGAAGDFVDPRGVAVDPDGTSFFVADAGADKVVQVDAATLNRIGSVPAADPIAVDVSPDGRYLYILGSKTVTVTDLTTGRTVATIPTGNSPANDIALSPDGRELYVSNMSGDIIVVGPVTETGRVVGSDADGDTLTYEANYLPAQGTMTINSATGEFTYTGSHAGVRDVDVAGVTITDGHGGSKTIPVTVGNTSPTVSLRGDPGGTGRTSDWTLVTNDVDADALTVTVTDPPDHGWVLVTPSTTQPGTYILTYHRSALYGHQLALSGVTESQPDPFTVVTSDGRGGSVSTVVTAWNDPVNTAPDVVDVSQGDSEIPRSSSMVEGAPSDIAVTQPFSRNGEVRGLILVADPVDGTLRAVSATDATTLSASQSPFPADTTPDVVAIGPSVSRVYTASTSAGTLTVYDSAANPTTFDVGGHPDGMALSSDGRSLYLTDSEAATLTVVDTETMLVVRTLDLGVRPVDPVLSSDGKTLYVTDNLADRLLMVDTESGAITSVGVGRSPTSPVISPDGTTAYTLTARDGDGWVWVTDLENGSDDHIPVGGAPSAQALSADGKYLYVAVRDRILIIDTTSPDVVGSVSVSDAPQEMVVDPQTGSLVYTDAVNQRIGFINRGQVTGDVVARDAESDTLSYAVAAAPEHGTVVIDRATGKWIYISDAAGLIQDDSFTITVTDGVGAATTATVVIEGTIVEPAPVAV